MKRSNFSNVLRRITVVVLLSGFATSFCNAQRTVSNESLRVTITGDISHTEYKSGQSGTVTFNRFPTTVEEFKQVREQIGGEPHGAVALQLMAFEMFRHDRKIGEECIRMNSVNSSVPGAIRRLNELFGKDASYARPYQVAGFLKDAEPKNGYSPSKPYTVEVKVNPGIKYQESSIFQTDVIYLQVSAPGRKDGKVNAAVLKTHKPDEPSEGKYFIMFECSNLYFQVEPISFTATFDGLD